MVKHICDYGCGQEAIFQLKSGKWCCSKSVNSCPEMRRKNSGGIRNYCKTHVKNSSRGMKGKTPWNKGKTSKTDERIAAIATKNKVTMLGKSHPQSEETRAKISKSMKEKGLGGLRSGSGRGKKGWYKGYYCDSTWELAYIIYNLEHGIPFSRNTKSFDYVFNDENKKYHPDFLLETGEYVEVKGYYTKQFAAKIEQFPKEHTLIIYDKNGIKPFLDYVIDKYGKDFCSLYDGAKPKPQPKPKEPKPKAIRSPRKKREKSTRKKVERFCETCGCQLFSEQKRFCSHECYDKFQARNIPSYEELLELKRIEKSNVKIGKRLGVSDVAVKKWFKKYENLS